MSPSHLEKGRCKTLQNAPLTRFSSAEVIIMDKYIGLIFSSSSSWILIGVSFLDVATPSLTHPHDGVAYSCGSALQTRLVVEHTSQKFWWLPRHYKHQYVQMLLSSSCYVIGKGRRRRWRDATMCCCVLNILGCTTRISFATKPSFLRRDYRKIDDTELHESASSSSNSLITKAAFRLLLTHQNLGHSRPLSCVSSSLTSVGIEFESSSLYKHPSG